MKTVIAALTGLLILCLFSTVSFSSEAIDLTIKVTLVDGSPLPNALVRVAPSIFYANSKKYTVENFTDADGVAILKNVMVNPVDHTVYLEIHYGIYGLIYSYNKLSIEKMSQNLSLPYRILMVSMNIVDEYLNGVEGNFTLYYNGKTVIEGEFTNGNLIIDGRKHKHYILIGDRIEYRIKIITTNTTKEEVISGTNNIFDKTIVLDLYKPVIHMEYYYKKYNEKTNIWQITLSFTVRDGVYSGKVRTYIKAKLLPSGRKVYGGEIQPSEVTSTRALYNVTLHIVSSNDRLLVLNITTIDLSGKSSQYVMKDSLDRNISKPTKQTSPYHTKTTSENKSNYTKSIIQATDTGSARTSSWYTIPSDWENRREQIFPGIHIYIITVFISLGVIVAELRSRRVKWRS